MPKTKETIRRKKRKNVRIFPIYKTVSWDLLFYFPIIFLFLTQVKGLTPAEVLFADAFYTLANTFWQLPITSLVDRIGKKNCLIIGNILYALSILAMIFMKDFYELLLIQFIYALGYSIKGICESNILYDSLPASKKRGKVFAAIDGKSSSYFYIFDGISSIIAGFAFAINGYIPMVLCFICCVASTIISFKFRHTVIKEEKVKPISLKKYFKQLKDSMKFFKKSDRIRLLILLNAIFMGLILGIVNLRSSMLSEMQVPEIYFGIIFALLQFSAAITARNSERFHKALRNKVLGFLTFPVTISCIIIGFIVMLVSCKFAIGALVIGSGSMTGTIDKGDIIVYERYGKNESVKTGDIIIFRSDDLKIVHRVIDQKLMGEETRYYTKGDANQKQDDGYRTSKDVIGQVKFKIPYIGYLTLWVNNLIGGNK